MPSLFWYCRGSRTISIQVSCGHLFSGLCTLAPYGSGPDTAAIPQLAQILGISIEERMTSKPAETPGHRGSEYLVDLILKAVPLAMGIAVTVTSVFGEPDMHSGFSMLGIGLVCLAIRELKK